MVDRRIVGWAEIASVLKLPRGEREPRHPGSLREEGDRSLEARPEAGFSPQGRAFALTALEALLLQVTVGHVRQVFEALPQKCHGPR
jgi:hypothetical protein